MTGLYYTPYCRLYSHQCIQLQLYEAIVHSNLSLQAAHYEDGSLELDQINQQLLVRHLQYFVCFVQVHYRSV